MAARPCPISLCECPGVDAPITNISAEAPDPLLFWGQIWNPYNPYKPIPLGNGPYVKVDCNIFNEIFSIYDPIVYASTQLMANLQALAASLGCPWPTSGIETFFNDAQTATVYCADGTAYSYTVDAGTMTSPAMDAELGAVWVLWANAWAEAYALQQASELLDCIVPTQTPTDPDNPDNPPVPPVPPQPPGPTPPTPPLGAGILTNPAWMCFGEEIVRTYVISGFGAGAYTISIIAGAIPPGTTFVQTGPRRAVLSGTPTAPGVYNFTIQGVGTTPSVAVQATDYLYVFGISNANTLPDADAGVPYGPETLIGVGGTAPYTFASSNLPTGFSLSSGGVLTSDATTIEDDYTFDVVITDANAGECTQQCSIVVSSACPDWPSLVWTAPVLLPGLLGGSCSATALGDTVNVAAIAGLGTCSEVHGMTGTLSYSGDAWDGYIIFNVTNYIDVPHPTSSIQFYFEVRQGATLLGSCSSNIANPNDFTIVDADGVRNFLGDLPNSFVIHLHGAATIGATITVQTGGAGWLFCCSNPTQSEMTYDLKFSCSPTP